MTRSDEALLPTSPHVYQGRMQQSKALNRLNRRFEPPPPQGAGSVKRCAESVHGRPVVAVLAVILGFMNIAAAFRCSSSSDCNYVGCVSFERSHLAPSTLAHGCHHAISHLRPRSRHLSICVCLSVSVLVTGKLLTSHAMCKNRTQSKADIFGYPFTERGRIKYAEVPTRTNDRTAFPRGLAQC